MAEADAIKEGYRAAPRRQSPPLSVDGFLFQRDLHSQTNKLMEQQDLWDYSTRYPMR